MIVKNLQEFHKVVCERDKYICCVCGTDYSYSMYFNENGLNTYVCAHHHPHTQKARPDLKFDTDNGVCICESKSCHTKAHKGEVEIPETEPEELEGAIEGNRKAIENPTDHILPNGQRVQLNDNDKLCKCGFIAGKSGKCMGCERHGNKSYFKKEKKKKRKG